MSANEFRVERDSMGELQVPADALWGAQTQRAVQNFPISGLPMPRGFIRALGARQVGGRRARTSKLGDAATRCAARDPEGGARGRRRAARRALPGRRVPDRLGHQHQHECQRGDRAPRHAAFGRHAGASERSRQHEPEQQRRDPDRDPRQRCARDRRAPAARARRSLSATLDAQGGRRRRHRQDRAART